MTERLTEILEKAAAAPASLDADDLALLRRIAHSLPASALAPALMLKYFDSELADSERESLRERVALYCGRPDTVIKAIDPEGLGFDRFYRPAGTPPTPSTESAIDKFLATYGSTSPEEEALLERMIFNPVPEYAGTLAAEADAAGDTAQAEPGSQDALIDAFLAKNPVAEHALPQPEPAPEPVRPAKAPKTAPAPAPDGLLSESLAKIFIKQGRYERAYEIITNLSLNYPKKSVYFADQLRFLQKLIINKRKTEQARTDAVPPREQ